ncbi:MAG: glycosyltransferase family 4 protein [Flavobacteriaceae bacterium]|nr:glycosyltransferase family 4 protein [Flavobacteriaceae bacterium]
MKKVLIITYYWPPAGGPGVQRWLKFVKYLKDFDIEPIIYVPENPHYPLRDESLINEIPENTTILKQPIKEPYGFAKIFSKKKTQKISSGIISEKKQGILEKMMLWVRGNFFIPDARVGWVKPSVKFLKVYLKANPVDVIVSSGPPHSLHLIGMGLKNETGIPWLTDFRDPWTTIGYHKKLRLSKRSQMKHKQFELNVLTNCDAVIVTSPSTKRQFENITDKPITVITNGFDVALKPAKQLDDDFTISHIGSLLSERNPKILWKVLSEMVKENEDFASKFKLQLAGTISDEVVASIENHGLKNHLKKFGYVSHSESVDLQKKSQVLLMIEIDSKETQAIIPGKLFEYMASGRPILALGPKDSDVEPLINSTQSGTFFEYSQEREIKIKIYNWFELYKNKKLVIPSQGIEAFSRKNLTKKLAEVLLQLH